MPKLPAPEKTDLSKGILEAIDIDSYRAEKQATQRIQLSDSDAEIGPVPTSGGGGRPGPEMNRLSNIIKAFNDHFGNIPWEDKDRILREIVEDIPRGGRRGPSLSERPQELRQAEYPHRT